VFKGLNITEIVWRLILN